MTKYLYILFALFTLNRSHAQSVSIKTNLLYGATTLTPNLSLETKVAPHFSVQASGSYNPWNLQGSRENNKKLVHWVGSLQGRYWLKEAFNGHFFGYEVLGSQYNISQQNLTFLFGKNAKDYRFEGYAVGTGVSYGYFWAITNRIALEATIGLGYIYLEYDRYECILCGDKTSRDKKNYFGPTRIGLSFAVTLGKVKNPLSRTKQIK